MDDQILPIAQFAAYLEVGREDPLPTAMAGQIESDLWKAYKTVAEKHRHFAMRKVRHRREIYPVFRDLFKKESAKAA